MQKVVHCPKRVSVCVYVWERARGEICVPFCKVAPIKVATHKLKWGAIGEKRVIDVSPIFNVSTLRSSQEVFCGGKQSVWAFADALNAVV